MNSGGIAITEHNLQTFRGLRACCREGRSQRPSSSWCRKKTVIRSKHERRHFRVREAAWRRQERRTVIAANVVRNNEVAGGGGLDASVARKRPRTAMARSAEPIGGDASFEERGAASERKLARLAVARSAPPWFVSLTNRHKKGADLCRVMAGAGPEGYRYAAARRTGIPILRALSTRLLVSPSNVDRRCQGLSEHDIIGTFQCVME